jgi:hypothetical protein
MNWRAKIVRVRQRLFEAYDSFSLGTAETQRERAELTRKKRVGAKAVLNTAYIMVT